MITLVTIPYRFLANTTADAIAVNSNFEAFNAKLTEIITALNASTYAIVVSSDPWVSGTPYNAGDKVWSPVDFGTYRAKADNPPTDLEPSTDTAQTYWQRLSYNPDAETLNGFAASQSPVAGQIPAVKDDSTTAFPGGISVGNANTNGGAALLNWIERGVTALLTVTSGMSGSVTGNAKLSRLGDLVSITLPVLTGTSNGNNFVVSGIPSDFRPLAIRKCTLGGGVTDAGTAAFGRCDVNTNGTLTLYHDAAGTVWSAAAATKALQAATIIYEI